VVLVVIGLILGAVSIGKDLQRNAEFKKIYTGFVQQWALSYNEYFTRAGLVLGDTIAAGPSLRVGGAAQTLVCDANPPAIAGAATTMRALMVAAGVGLPSGRAEGRESRYIYLDSNGNPMEMRVCFINIPWYDSVGVSNNNKNVMVLMGVTPDLARMLDSMIDGRPDARFGDFRDSAVGWGAAFAAPAGNIAADWSNDNTAGGLDEAQIPVLTAYYRMNK
jgi:hypothetical protein